LTRAVVVCFHKYQPYGGEYYEPILDFFIKTMEKYKDEYDHVYFLDSNWNIDPSKLKDLNATIIRIDPSTRYYDAYKEALPQIKEDLVLFMDNDTVVYKEDVIRDTFGKLEHYGVVSIIDEIGDYKTDLLSSGNKFCPYWFATRKKLLMKYLDVDWGSHMPHSETLGHLTEAMLNDGIRVLEWWEDKSSLHIDGTEGYPTNAGKGKNLGYYHIRAGSVPALLLAYKDHDTEKYDEYLKNQPKNEYLRQMAWFWYITDNTHVLGKIIELVEDLELGSGEFGDYTYKFRDYHGL